MECYDCHHHNPPGSKFCSNCGKSFVSRKQGARNDRPQREQREPRVQREPDYPHKEGLAALDEWEKRRLTLQLQLSGVTAVIVVVGCLGTLFTKESAIFIVCMVLALIMGAWIATLTTRSSSDYYELPGSTDEHGDHRCIHCGHRGIYRRTPYATQSTIASCSKCQAELFRAPAPN
jgi:predicted RNA-binding Zn-ribbon protein involved in translation (DUF1610 family)